jgi:hypothetical protein
VVFGSPDLSGLTIRWKRPSHFRVVFLFMTGSRLKNSAALKLAAEGAKVFLTDEFTASGS